MDEDSMTFNFPRRRRWYTRLWHSCRRLGCLCHQRSRQFHRYQIGYDPVGPLQRAASVGDLVTTESMIYSREHHVDEYDRRGRTSLHYACVHNHPDVVTLLLEYNSNINIQDDEGCTPLIKAVQCQNTDCVYILLRHNANPNLTDFHGNTAFHHAASRGNIKIVKLLLKYNVDFEAKTKYGLTPLQLATYENHTEMIKFLESKSADAQAVQVSSSARRPAHKKKVKHVRFNKEVFVFNNERPLSRRVRSPRQLKSILKTSIQHNSEAGMQLTGRSPWCVNVDNVSSTSSVKGESGRKIHIKPKKSQNSFRKSGVYVSSRVAPILEVWEENTSATDEKTKMENFHSVPSEAAADVGPSTSTADSLDAAEPAQTKSTKEAASLTAVEPEPTKSTIAADSLTAVEPAQTKSTIATDSLTAVEPALTKSTKDAASLTAAEPAPTKSTNAADSLTAVEPVPTKSTNAADSLTAVEPVPTKSTIAADSLIAAEPAPTKSTTAADSLTAVEPMPTKSTTAADSLTAVEPAPTKSTTAAASLTAAEPAPTKSTTAADGLTADEPAPTKSTTAADGLTADEPELSLTYAADSTVSGDSGPASHIGLDYVVDLPLYKESTSEEEIFYTASSDEESSFIPDIEEGLPATQAPVDNFDASASAEPINHSMNPLRVGGYLRAPAIAHIPFLPFIWLVSSLFSVITWMKIQIQHAWHEENGQGAPTDKKVGSVAAAPDP
ncbi:mucin-5AC-like isoform X2 [Rattus norvegicus]|uniref:POTE ankyrin domain family member M like 2 isoform 2 n=1 Tax=Rattus norvegicus TaxID=10116 RepID=UPI002FD80929